MQKSHALLVEALHNPACYDHPVSRVSLVETHISWVFLAGNYAYKLKKPINFGFLDFSSLAKRRHFCREELRLNRRFAPQLYLDVISIGGTPSKPVLGGSPAIDFLVKMKRFPRQNELDLLLQQQRLSAEMIEKFADYLAELHQQLPRIRQQSEFGTPAVIRKPPEENFRQLRPLLPDKAHQAQLTELENWTLSNHNALSTLMEQRKTAGFIRECHGDVHLANMVWLDDKPVLFDCIEFNDNFRCIDVCCDYAFLLMDLDDHGAEALSWQFLNRYLQQTGDYQGLPLLNYYKCYRAMVRAKVTGLRLNQLGLSEAGRQADTELLQSYLNLASSYSKPRKPTLIISHGLSGSGKSTFINQLAPLYGAVSIHSDIERKRLHGLTPTAQSGSQIAGGIYTAQAHQQTYNRLLELAEDTLKSGFSVVIDATFLLQAQRNQMQQLAFRLGMPFIILDFSLPETELFRRIELRSRKIDQISEATASVLKRQLAQAQSLSTEELQKSIRVDSNSSPTAVSALLNK